MHCLKSTDISESNNMKKINKRYIIFIILTVLSLFSIVFIFLSTRKKTVVTTGNVKVVFSVPTDGANGVSVFNPIELKFNQEVDPSLIEVFSDPSETWTVKQTQQGSFELNHKSYLRVATKYKLTISYDGKVVDTLNFETVKEQNDPRMLQNYQDEMDKDYPLAKLTPYETPDYRVVYTAPLTLEINIKSLISTQAATLKIQSWVRQNGEDPSTHKYIAIPASNQ